MTNETYRYAVIGTGKTGGMIAQLLGAKAVPFDEFNPPTPQKLRTCDIAIVFVPGSAAAETVEIVLEAGIPAIWGTTGYDWPDELIGRVHKANTKWVIGSNFSLGMNLIRRAIQIMGKGADMLPDPAFHIHEVHHIHKQDAPSGTALSWQKWLGRKAEISSDRQGDVKGIHNLQIKTEHESITMNHEAHSREVFAAGAIWAADYLLTHPGMNSGFYQFSDIFDKAFTDV